MILEKLAPFVPLALSTVALIFSVETLLLWKRRAEWAREQAIIAIERLTLMERAQDPGREVHVRLAEAMEAEMVLDGPAIVEGSAAAARRSAAMEIARRFLATCARAKLRVVADDEEADSD